MDGILINVRPGHPANPTNAKTALPEAVTVRKEQGLVCPPATAPVTLANPDAPEVELLYAGCAVAGVPRVKIGFFHFNPGEDSWALADAARKALVGFARVTEKHAVQTVYQKHPKLETGRDRQPPTR